MKKLILTLGVLYILLQTVFSQTPTVEFNFSGNTQEEISGEFGVNHDASLTSDRFNCPNQAYAFDENFSSIISAGDGYDFISEVDGKFSISLWFKRTDTNSVNDMIISKYGGSNCGEEQREFGLQINKNHKILFQYFTQRDRYIYDFSHRAIEASTVIKDTLWHHVVINYNGSIDSNDGLDRVTIYLDNQLEGTSIRMSERGLGDIINTDSQLAIGANSSVNGTFCGNTFNGHIDDIKIFDEIITPNKTDSLFNITQCNCGSVRYVTIYDTTRIVESIRIYDTIPVYDSIAVSDTLIIKMDLVASNITYTGNINLYPNPTKDFLNIRFDSDDFNQGLQLNITSIDGTVLITRELNTSNNIINLDIIESYGIYFVNITNSSGDTIVTRKLLIQ